MILTPTASPRASPREAPDDFIKQANDFARNRPSLFMGSAVLAGIALAQLFKSSAPEEELPSGSAESHSELRSGPMA